MNLDNFTLKVKDMFGDTYQINCFGVKHSIEYLKNVSSWETRIPPNSLSLYVANSNKYEELKDYNSIEFYNINKDSDIRMFIKMKSGLI